MAEYFTAAKLLYFIAKDVYYTSKVIHATIKSASRKDKELAALQHDIFIQLSLITWFANLCWSEIRRHPPGANLLWIPRVEQIFKDIQSLFAAEYQRGAQLSSAEYQNFSVQYANFQRNPDDTFQPETAEPHLLLGGLDEDTDLDIAALSNSAGTGSATAVPSDSLVASGRANQLTQQKISFKEKIKKSFFESATGIKWAVWNKPKLEKFLYNLKPHVEDLRFMVSFVVSAQPLELLEKVTFGRQYPDGLGIEGHLGIRQLSARSLPTATQLRIHATSFQNSDPALVENISGLPKLENFDKYSVKCMGSTGLVPGKLRDPGGRIETVLVEYKCWETAQLELDNEDRENENEVENLALILAAASLTSLPVLKIRGYIKEAIGRYAFIFQQPEHSENSPPKSLAACLDEGDLCSDAAERNTRLTIARESAKCLASFHEDGWLHQSVCSDSITFFVDSFSKMAYTHPYFINFEFARSISATTAYASAKLHNRRLYQHPERLRSKPEKFRKGHDLYSLGVVLLELGLYTPARELYEMGRPKEPQSKGANLAYSQTFSTGSPSPGVSTHESSAASDAMMQDTPYMQDTEDYLPSGEEIQKVFLEVAAHRLPSAMDRDYAKAVRACLNDEYAKDLVQGESGAAVVTEILRLLGCK